MRALSNGLSGPTIEPALLVVIKKINSILLFFSGKKAMEEVKRSGVHGLRYANLLKKGEPALEI